MLRCRLALPAAYRPEPVLAFHRRDPAGASEQVHGGSLCKGLVWRGRPARLTITFADHHVSATLAVDGDGADDAGDAPAALVSRMLGLDQPVTAFEARWCGDPVLGPLLRRQAGLRVPVSPTPFEALSWAITGQQISVAAAVTIRRRLIEAAGIRHSSGLGCYPDAAHVATLGETTLRAAGYSAAKARALLALADAVRRGTLPLDAWLACPSADAIRPALLAIRGIGPWTVEYALLRGFGWLDGSLHGDVAVRRSLARLLGRDDALDARFAREWLAPFAPWRALVAAHLWAMPSAG